MVPRPWAEVKVFSLHIAFHPLIWSTGKKGEAGVTSSKEMFRFQN
jgi:hypothetical protein